MSLTVQMKGMDEVKKMLGVLVGDDVNKALMRGINKTLTGVRTDGVKLLTNHYALTATVIRNHWNINNAAFRDPHGVVACSGTFIRLMEFGAKQDATGVSVKVLKDKPRATVPHAFIARHGLKPQVYWRAYRGPRKPPVSSRRYSKKMPMMYRFPIKALYGPRIQDYLADPQIIGTLQRLAGERLEKNMVHEVDYLLSTVR